MSNPTCETCRWYHDDGHCRRYPPTVVVSDPAIKQFWPEVELFHWCGEHTPRVPDLVMLRDTELTVRTLKVLHKLGCVTLQDVATKTSKELLAQRTCGVYCLFETAELLNKHGLQLADGFTVPKE